MKYLGDGRMGGGWGGRSSGWEAEGRLYHPEGDKPQCCVLSRAQKQLVNLVGRDGCQQQSDIPCAQLMPLSGSMYKVLKWQFGSVNLAGFCLDSCIYVAPVISKKK